MMVRLKIKIVLILLILSTGILRAQDFRYHSYLDSVKASGFHMVPLDTALCAKIKVDFSDLRIADQRGKWVPHVIQAAKTPIHFNSFTEFPIQSNKIIDSGKTELIVRNTSDQKVFNLKLFIKNVAVSRLASISGSNDGKKWFIIREHLVIQRSYESAEDEFLQEINIPMSTYSWFKLVIDNNNNDPLNITRAGFYNQVYFKTLQQFYTNPAPFLVQADTANQSIVTLQWKDPVHIERLRLSTEGIKFYNRYFRICLPADDVALPGRAIGHFRLTSFTDSSFDIPRIKTDRLFLVFENGDNPPLQITNVNSEQRMHLLISHLDKPGVYQLLFGDENAPAPNYDLGVFRDSIPPESIYLKAGAFIEKNRADSHASSSGRWWLWPTIITAILILGWLTYTLSREMKKNQS